MERQQIKGSKDLIGEGQINKEKEFESTEDKVSMFLLQYRYSN